MAVTQRVRARVKQQALRAMCCDGNGKLHGNAKVVLADLREFCGAEGKGNPFPRDLAGTIDPLAMARAVGRREVFDRIAKMLAVTLEDRHNLEDGL